MIHKIIILLFISFPLISFSQEDELKKNTEKLNIKVDSVTKEFPDSLWGWKKGGTGSITFAQASLSNWASGGQNTIAANSFKVIFLRSIDISIIMVYLFSFLAIVEFINNNQAFKALAQVVDKGAVDFCSNWIIRITQKHNLGVVFKSLFNGKMVEFFTQKRDFNDL